MQHKAYYSEWDPYCAQWLRNLIAAGHIAPGEVDERSITEVQPDDLSGFTQCHFFAGLGGWAYAARLSGWPDDRPIWTGSCPCQPFSFAGKRTGVEDERHLWPEFFRLIASQKPIVIAGEQVAAAIGHKWWDAVATDLEGEGYSVWAGIIPAFSVGAPHRRDRLWFLADAQWDEQSRQEPRSRADRRVGWQQQPIPWASGWKSALARFRAVDDGIPRRVAATDAARNAIVPQVGAEILGAFLDCERLAP